MILGSKIRFESPKKHETKPEDLTGKSNEQLFVSFYYFRYPKIDIL